MLPQTLPEVADFKREYKFIWFIQGSRQDIWSKKLNKRFVIQDSGIASGKGLKSIATTLNNLPYCTYVSQLTESVTIPDDEFEIETLKQGPVDFQMPTRTKLSNIVVTYMDDSLESVYNFHRTWFDAIRCGPTGVGMNSPSRFCAVAKYIEFENTLTATEYLTYRSKLVENITTDMAKFQGDIVNNLLPGNIKTTAITIYPRLYPVKINRTAANHTGKGLAKVTVTYARIPQFYVNHTPLMKLDGGKWSNVTDSKSLLSQGLTEEEEAIQRANTQTL